MSKRRFRSVWNAIGDTPGDAADVKACAEWMRAKIDVFSPDRLEIRLNPCRSGAPEFAGNVNP